MRCNIYKPLSCDTGELLMFSQYADDITNQLAGPTSYRVMPSKFAVLNLDINRFKNFIVDTVYEGVEPGDLDLNLNKEISQYIQSYYENMICVVKSTLTDSNNQDAPGWDSAEDDDYAGQLLWKALEHAGLISITEIDNNDNYYTIPELHFIGDINIHSDKLVDGMNYNDIYCYISPNDGDRYYIADNINVGAGQFSTQNIECIDGWTPVSYPTNTDMTCEPWFDKIDGQGIYYIADHPEGEIFKRILFDSPSMPRDVSDPGVQNESYQFNCIIVFYDIYNYMENEASDNIPPAYKNKPLGIYFTGPIDKNSDYYIKNTVTKYISNEDVFGQGSGWGLRLMTRIVPTPNSSTYWAESDSGDDYTTVAAALGRIADSIADIRTNMNNQMQQFQSIKEHLAEFRNYRTNIPYPMKINETWYWFVNGRNTGRTIYYTPEE